jgi:hypothetical protein
MTNFEDEIHFYPHQEGDPHYEAIGRVASAWAFFDFHVSQQIWWLAAVDDERGACLTSNMMSINMRMNTLLALIELEARFHKEPNLHDKRPAQDTLPAFLKELNALNNKQVAPLSKERNRIVHDTWMYGKKTGHIAQIRATADKRLDYRFTPASIEDINKAHRKILRLDQDFQLLAQKVRARLHLLKLAEPPAQQNESAQQI